MIDQKCLRFRRFQYVLMRAGCPQQNLPHLVQI